MASIQSKFFRFLLKRFKAQSNWYAPVTKQRVVFEKNMSRMKMPCGVTISPIVAGGTPGEWLTPVGVNPARVLLHLHGGGYVTGSCRTHRAMVSRLACAAQMRGLLLDYRLAPEHPFPAAVEDALATYRWLIQNGLNPRQMVIAGDSAGGGLTLATLLALPDAGDPLPAAAVCISPLTDLAATGESIQTCAEADPWLTPEVFAMIRLYWGGHDCRLPLLSPLYADLRGLPPLLIHVGTDEILLNDSTRLAERASEAGVHVTLEIWPDMWHVWHLFAPYLPEARQAIDRLGRFMQQQVGSA